MYRYELFQFARTFSLSRSTPANHDHGNVEVVRYAWREEEEKSFLALVCSNDYLLLHYKITGHRPITKQLSWPPQEQIVAMCFDPTLSWLLVVTESLYIIPALSSVDPKARVDQLFAIHDATVLNFEHARDSVTCAVWWQTLDGRQIAVLGTKTGEIIFVDLQKRKPSQITKKIESIHITNLSLSHDDVLMNTSLLITPQNGNQWHYLLETRTTIQSFTPDSGAKELGYDNVDGRTIPPRSILDQSETSNDVFKAKQFTNFQPPTHFRPQYAKGHHFITAHSSTSSTLHVLESSAGHNELFVYRLPNDADNVLLTDKLIFTTINHSRERTLIALANQKSEQSNKQEDGFNSQSVMQEFLLPEDERLVGIEMKRYPFYFHEHQETDHIKRIRKGSVIQPSKSNKMPLKLDVLEVPITSHTVLDGCTIITTRSLYEIRPWISPERLFLHLALMLNEIEQAEYLAISLGLDLMSLSKVAAEYMLARGNFTKAIKLYNISKCQITKQIGGLAQYGCIPETTSQLKQILNNADSDVPAFERKLMSNMLLHCFLYQLHSGTRSSWNIQTAFEDYLSHYFSFDEQLALTLLSDFKEIDLLLSFAKSRGLIMDALKVMGKAEAYADISHSSLHDLVQKGFIAHLIHSGSLIPCLPPEDFVKLLITRPQLAIQHCNFLKPLLTSVKPGLLLELAGIFDPSKPVMKGVLRRSQRFHKRTNSLSSLSSYASEAVDSSGESQANQSEALIEFFLTVVLFLNNCRRKETQDHMTLNLESLIADPLDAIEQIEESSSSTNDSYTHLSVQVQLIAGGPKHTAAIRNGDLYTWGKASLGRLGIGDESQSIRPPKVVETLFNLKLTVQAVACGNEHTLALTNQGVYGWGCSTYGQVGAGTTMVYYRPMFLETLQSENIVALTCGFYHSLALTADRQVYTWGWGVHGQLGHGDPEDCLTPRHVKSLLKIPVMNLAAGYAHSLVLCEEGNVYSFGCGYFGQLGCGVSMKSSLPQKIKDIPDPVRTIATKYFHSVAVTVTNKVYTWGCHPHNLRQLASSVRQARHSGRQISEPNSFYFPRVVDTIHVSGKIIKAACGSLHTAMATDEGCVYSWGRNLEGQLGTGTRQDEQHPKMLTSMNSQHVLDVESGGEYTLVIDAEASIWLWGKNDCGQLSYSRTRRDSNRARGTLYLQGSEFMTPTMMKSLPTSDPNNQKWMSLLSSLSQSCTGEDSQEETSEVNMGYLPNLDRLGAVLYPSVVVPVTLKAFDNILESSSALQKSVDLKDWICASQISCLEEDYIQALYYRLQLLSEKMKDLSVEDVVSIAVPLVAHHLELVLRKPKPLGIQITEPHILCQQALEFWRKHSLPIQELEELFSHHLPILAPWLLKVVLSTRPKKDGASPELTFSSLFALEVLKLSMQASSVMPGPAGIDLSHVLDSGDSARPDLRPREKLDPRERLWSYILTNMKNDDGAIRLSQNAVQRMEDQADQIGGPQKFVIFSCGHSYPESTYKDVVTSLATNLSSEPNKLTHSPALLQELLLRPGLKTSACPKCIEHGLHSS